MILGDRDAVVVPGSVAVWLDAKIGDRRAGTRDLDAQLYRVLLELHEVALATRVRRYGTPPPQPAEQRPTWITTDTAAQLLGIGDRGVRQAIKRGRLPARRIDGHWEIHRDDVEAYRSRRCA